MFYIIILAGWLWGINVFVWHRSRINHSYIFGLNPASTLGFHRIFKVSVLLFSFIYFTYFSFWKILVYGFSDGVMVALICVLYGKLRQPLRAVDSFRGLAASTRHHLPGCLLHALQHLSSIFSIGVDEGTYLYSFYTRQVLRYFFW